MNRFSRRLLPWRGSRETPHLVRIAWPLTFSALTNMAVAITDVVMMGWISPLALGAGAAVSDIYSIVFYLCAGVAAAGVPILAGMIGAGDRRGLGGALLEVCAATVAAGLVCFPLVWHGAWLLEWLGLDGDILPAAHGYAHWMSLALLPMLLFRAGVAWFSAREKTRVVFYATLGSVPLNILGNGAFMFGWFGFPAMGMPGAGVSSFLVSLYLVAAITILLMRDGVFDGASLRISRTGVLTCWRTGIPIGVSSLGELGVYLMSTVVMVKFGAAAVAAHAVALRLSGLLYAIPLGLSQAVTVRVAYWQGAGRDDRIRRSVRTGMVLALAVGVIYLIGIAGAAGHIAQSFLGTAPSAGLAVVLLTILAAVEFFTAPGTVAFGALRGIKDTRVPMLYSLSCLWGLGFGAGMTLGFAAKAGAAGFWLGLLLGTVAIAGLGLVRVRRTFFGQPKSAACGPLAYEASSSRGLVVLGNNRG
jgi:MATE family multidrug resistance protein